MLLPCRTNIHVFELRFVVKMIAASVLASAVLEFRTYFQEGMYFGRVYPVSFRNHQLDANYFALLVVVQVSCAFLVALYSRRKSEKIIYMLFLGWELYPLFLLALGMDYYAQS